MKKLISVAAFLAASSALANAAELVVSFYANSDPSTKTSAWDMVYDKTTAEAATGNVNAAKFGNYGFSQSFALSSLLNTDTSFTLGDNVVLNSFSLIARPSAHASAATSGVYLKISDADGNQVALSNEIDVSDLKTDDSKYGSLSFSFSDDVTLSTSTVYTYSLADSAGGSTSSLIGVGIFNAKEGYNFSSTQFSDTQDERWYRMVYKVDVSAVIPEPSAFGLLAGVGALALVAARRRRRAK